MRELEPLMTVFLVSEHHRSGAWPTKQSAKKAFDAAVLILTEIRNRAPEIEALIKSWEEADREKHKAEWEAEQKQQGLKIPEAPK